jgi:hypothetical protein
MGVVQFGEAMSDIINGISALLLLGFEKSVAVLYGLQAFFQNVVATVQAGLMTAFQAAASILLDAVKAVVGVVKYINPVAFAASKVLDKVGSPTVKTYEQNLADAKAGQKPVEDYKPLVNNFQEALAAVAESGGLKDTLAKIRESAGTDFAVAGEAIKKLFEKIKTDALAIGQDFKPGEVFQTAEWKAELAELAKSLNVPLAAVEEAAKKTVIPEGQDALQEVSKQAKPTDTDAWAKVGLFAGGASAAMDFARRTAEATATIAEQLKSGIFIKNFEVRSNGAVAQ